MMRRFGNEDQATSAAMALASNKLAARIKTLGAAREGPEAQARALEMTAKLNEQAGNYLATTYKLKPMGGGGGGGDHDRKRREKIEDEDRAHRNAMSLKAAPSGEDGSKDQDKLNSGTEKLSKDLAASNLPKYEADLARAKEAFEKAGDEGFNPVSQFLYNHGGAVGRKGFEWLHTPEAAQRQQAQAALNNAFYKDTGGAAINASEDARYQRQLDAGNYKGALRGILAMAEDAAAERSNRESGYDPKVVKTARERNTQKANSAKVDK